MTQLEFKINYDEYFSKISDNNMFLSHYDEISLYDFKYDTISKCFLYPCPCGDFFSISYEEIMNGEKIARCFSCSLIVLCIYNETDIEILTSQYKI